MAYRDRFRAEGTFQLNLTPLLDVVLQLITFFMMLVHFASKVEGESNLIKLPEAPAALPGGDLTLDRLVVSLDSKGELITQGNRFDETSADAWWAEQARQRRGGLAALGKEEEELPTQVVVRADKAVSFGAVRRLLTSAQERGFARFSLIVIKGGER